MQIKIVSEKIKPEDLYPQTMGSAGIDLFASDLEEPIEILFGTSYKVDTGIRVAIPEGYTGLVIPRSGSGVAGLNLANTVGVIDSDYRGNLYVFLRNNRRYGTVKVEPMQRIAQLVVVPVYFYHGSIRFVDKLNETDRGEGGFGSTGV